MPIYKSDQIQLEGRQFKVEYITADVANNTATTLLYSVKDYDSHNAYNTGTGIYTVPVSGKYRVTGGVSWSLTGSVASDGKIIMNAFKNGSIHSQMTTWTSQVASPNFDGELSGSTTINCNAGDTINISGLKNSSITYTANSSASGDYICIERVGN